MVDNERGVITLRREDDQCWEWMVRNKWPCQFHIPIKYVVGSMKKHAEVMRKAKAAANGLPGIVIGGNNGSNKARATHLLWLAWDRNWWQQW